MKVKKELWLTNLSKADVSLSDLGVRVLVGKTINVYSVNPYLTEDQVDKSMRDGSLCKRLGGTNPVLKVVKAANKKTGAISKLKQSKESFKVKKTKSSITIENVQDLDTEQSEAFDFADYGVGNISNKSSNMVKDQASVFIKAKEDTLPVPQDSDVINVPKVDSNISKQSTVVMDTMKKNIINPVGPLADTKTNKNSPYVVTKPPDNKQEVIEKPKSKSKINKEDGSILVGVTKDSKNSKAKFNTVRRANDSSDSVIEFSDAVIDTKVATKIDGNSVVMELKELPKNDEVDKVKPSKKK